MVRRAALATLLLVLVWPSGARAEIRLPPGFSAHVYVTGEGFDPSASRAGPGIPAVSTLVVDEAGALYLARSGRRYMAREDDGLEMLYRIPPGGARLTPASEARYFYGPPLWNPQLGLARAAQELLVTTFDRERRIGVLHRMVDGRATLLAGGTPERGVAPLLRQPEGVALDAAGNLYVADREQGVILKLDPAGGVLDPAWARVTRPRTLAMDARGTLWIGADGPAESPWQAGPGELWRVGPDGTARLVLRGPMAAGIALGPDGHLFVADRQGARVLAVTPDGARTDFATFTDGDAPRGLGVAPVTPATRRLGIAGDLFVVTVRRGAWPVAEIVRISGPLEAFVRSRAP